MTGVSLSGARQAPRLLISAAHKSSGKTTVSVGLCAAFRQRGLAVQPFKKGPDYIDPMWLSLACGRACRNLDPFLTEMDEIRAMFGRASLGADLSLVEGNKGLYDGLALDGSNSNAALAHMLSLPVVLVIDARGMTRGIAPLILGYQAFDRNLNIAGVILNNLGGARHEAKLRAVIEHYTEVPVLGAVHHDPRLSIVERHLGLMPSNESGAAASTIAQIGALIGAEVDLGRLLEIAGAAPALAPIESVGVACRLGTARRVKIAIARDRAFGFYYADDLDAFEDAGAELVPFDTLHDSHLPVADGLFIGGGFPELFMQELEANATLRGEIRNAIEGGMPAYAECGGLMYLAKSLSWEGRRCKMVGAIGGEVVMHERPVGRGYVELQETANNPWPHSVANPGADPGANAGAVLRGHEFHYSALEHLGGDADFAYRVVRGHGTDGTHDGIVYRNLLASYCHLRSTRACNWVARFVGFVRGHAESSAMRAATADRERVSAP
jgi:cobyrinic acid a,c-diamide synthase